MADYQINPRFKPAPDIDPVLVRQTSEPDHLAAKREWFVEAASEAAVSDECTFFRYSVNDDPAALLIEGWTERPADQGEQRWSWLSGYVQGLRAKIEGDAAR